MIEIKETNARGVEGEFVVILTATIAISAKPGKVAENHAYLHDDQKWRKSCVGPHSIQGYYPSREQAEAALLTWLNSLEEYETRYGRKYPGGMKTFKRRTK